MEAENAPERVSKQAALYAPGNLPNHYTIPKTVFKKTPIIDSKFLLNAADAQRTATFHFVTLDIFAQLSPENSFKNTILRPLNYSGIQKQFDFAVLRPRK